MEAIDELHIEYRRVKDVVRWSKNPKRHDIGALVESIQRYGFIDPPKWDATLGALVYGNGRDEALAWMEGQGHTLPRGIRVDEHGDWWMPLKMGVDAPTVQEAEALAIDHNNLTMSGGDFTAFDMAKLWDESYTDILRALAATDVFPISVDGDALDALLAAPVDIGGAGDEFNAEPEDGPTRTSVGELWVIGDKHRLLVGDCTDAANVVRLMGGDKIDCIFTSPPYEQQRTYEGNMRADWRALVSGAMLVAVKHCEDDAQLFINLGLVHRDGRVIRYWDDFINDLEDGGWPLFGWYVWDKLNGMPGDWNGRLAPAHEWVFHFCREALRPRKTIRSKHAGKSVIGTHRNPDGTMKERTQQGAAVQLFKIPDSVIRIVQQKPDALVNEHPAPFPIALPEQFTQAYAGDIWYDPFLGSGTTLIAAHQTGRRCYGMEISPRYADVILRRAEAAGLSVVREG